MIYNLASTFAERMFNVYFVFSFFFRLNKTLLSRTFHDFTGQYNGILYSKLFNQEMVWSVKRACVVLLSIDYRFRSR